jgi:hypothetical protein
MHIGRKLLCKARRKDSERDLMSVEDIEKPESMAAFFDASATGYDAHMREIIFSAIGGWFQGF